jgi:hypothetical protein
VSLVQARWVVPGAAAAVAVIVPLWLLSSAAPETRAAPPLVVTELRPLPVGGLEQARTAPLFSPGRAPPQPPPSPEALAEAAAAPQAQQVPKLVGLVSRARGRGVALVRSSNGETVTIEPGQSVDGWQLIGIGRDRATFAANGERRVAALDFSNKNSAEGAPASSAPPPPGPPPPAGVPAGSVRQPLPAWPEPWLANQSGSSR